MSQSDICPICGEGQLSPKTERIAVEHRGVSGQIPSLYSLCDHCGSEQAGAAELRANKRTMIAFKKRVEGLLTGEEVRALRERLGLTQSQAARVFGGGPVAFSKYESDDVTQSDAMDKLLRLADTLPEVFARLADKAGLITSDKKRHAEWRTVQTYGATSSIDPLAAKRCQLQPIHTSIAESPSKYG